MKVNVEDLSSTRKRVDVVIPIEDVRSVRNKVFQEIKKSAKIKGFRPGKAPDGVVESMYKSEILSEAAARLVQSTLEDALKEASVSPVSRPEVAPSEAVSTDKDFTYSATFDVLPNIELMEYKGIPLKKEVKEVTDSDVEYAIEQLRNHKAEVKPYEKEKGVEKSDVAIVDFQGYLEGKLIEDLNRKDMQFLVGEGKMLPEFEENLLGMKKGEEKKFDVKYDEDFQIREVAGKEVNFKLTVKDILQRELPVIDDELAKGAGLKTLSELKEKIKDDLSRQVEHQSLTKMKSDLLDLIVERNEIEVPLSLVKEEESRMTQQIIKNMGQRGVKSQPIDEATQSMVQERALRNVKASMILGAISRKEGISVSEDDINENLSAVADSYNVPTEQVREAYERNNMLEGLEVNLAEQKVIDFLIKNADVEEGLI